MAGPLGWRARIGHIAPYIHGISPCALEEQRSVVPDGVEFIEAKLMFPEKAEPGVRDDTEAFPLMLGLIEQAAREVALQKPDVIMQMGGAISIFRGWGGDRDIVSKIEAATGIPAVTHGMAEVEAMKRMGIRKVVVVTPYAEGVNKALLDYFAGAGLEVVTLQRLGTVRDVYAMSPHGLFRPVKETFLNAGPADGVIIMCGAIRTFEIIQPLEDDIRKPVITAVQAGLWKALDMVNVRTPIKGYGKLLESL